LKFLSIDHLLRLHETGIAEFGGIPGIRDLAILESTAQAPCNYEYYGDADVVGCAAAYAYHIAQNHPFLDGNKRTAAYACEHFLLSNDAELVASEDDLYQMYIDIASGKLDRDEVEVTLRKWVII